MVWTPSFGLLPSHHMTLKKRGHEQACIQFLLYAMIHFLRLPLLAALAVVATPGLSPGQASAIAQQGARKQIIVLGTFHFASNQDAIKHGEIDILGTQRQAEIQELNDKLAGFAPDRILVEWKVVEDQPFVDSTYAEYLADRFTLRANEVYQIGYRQARRFDTGPPQCIDASGLFLYDTLNYAAGRSGRTAWFEAYMDSVVQLVMEQDSLHMHQRITEALRQLNSVEGTRLALAVNSVFAAARLGPLGDDAGAEFIGQWYLRNIRMYANICRSTRDADQRVLVIVGNGHRPIIEQMLRADPDWEVIEADRYLR